MYIQTGMGMHSDTREEEEEAAREKDDKQKLGGWNV